MSSAERYRLVPAWRAQIADMGLNPADILRVAGLAEDLLTHPEPRVSGDDIFALWRAAESLCPGVELGLAVAKGTTAETFSPVLFSALCSPNLAVAMDRMATYKQLCAPVRFELESTTGGGLKTSVRWVSTSTPPPPSLSTMELALIVRIGRMGTRQPVSPTRVSLPEMPGNPQPYEEFFGTRIQASQTGSIEFAREQLQIPFLTSNEDLWRAFEPDLRARLATLERAASTTQRVRAVLLESLPSGRANIAEVSRRLSVSARTLQRRLRQEDSNFNAVLASVREQLARHYLSSTELPCNEIAFLLGYEEPNSFFRAFHGWTGESPERHRQAHVH
ncbi:MAG: AraC family transcriptional regulator [Nannocystaceae bacterium]|nr:AraC family transcriptional regulator [Nannocystaceae bacterium]